MSNRGKDRTSLLRSAGIGMVGTAVLLSLLALNALQPVFAADHGQEQDRSSSTVGVGTPVSGTLVGGIQTDLGNEISVATPNAVAAPNACVAPIVQSGSIITGVNPAYSGRLIRNGVPSVCGADYVCSGVQSTSTLFSYETFDFINPSPDWQCVKVTLDTSSCSQQVYSAAYFNGFDAGNLCTNIQGAMGFSTANIYGYTLMVPPNTDFIIVNNTSGVVPPSSDCAAYTMTTTLCSTNYVISATKEPRQRIFIADNTGNAVVPMEMKYTNSGDFTASIDAEVISETVTVSVQDGSPAAVQTKVARAGAIVPAGKTVTQTIPLEFSGSPFTCLPRFFEITSQMELTATVYACNGFNPPSAVVHIGSVSRSDIFGEDAIAFESRVGTLITATIDTVAAATAFDIAACISGTPQGSCLPGFEGDNEFNCTFLPPANGCPRFGGLLPEDPDGDDIYYLHIFSGSGTANFAGSTGSYRATLLSTTGPIGACPVVPVLDDGARLPIAHLNAAASPAALGSTQVLSNVFMAQVYPVMILVPPSDPEAAICGQALLPVIVK